MATELDRTDLKYKSDKISLQLNTIQNIPISLSLGTQNPDSIYKCSAQFSSHRRFPPLVCIISSSHSVYQAPSPPAFPNLCHTPSLYSPPHTHTEDTLHAISSPSAPFQQHQCSSLSGKPSPTNSFLDLHWSFLCLLFFSLL